MADDIVRDLGNMENTYGPAKADKRVPPFAFADLQKWLAQQKLVDQAAIASVDTDAPELPDTSEVDEPEGGVASWGTYRKPAQSVEVDSQGAQDDDWAPYPEASQLPAHEAVKQILMRKRQPVHDDELAAAQSQANDARALVGVGKSLASAGNLFAHRKHGEGVDLSDYDRQMADADRPVQQILARRQSERAMEDQDFQRDNQDVADNNRQLNQDPESSKSVTARSVLGQIVPRLQDDPNFKDMSYETMVAMFPMFKQEIDSADRAANRENALERAKIVASSVAARINNPVTKQNAESRSEQTRLAKDKWEAEMSSRSFAAFEPRPGVIPSAKQAEAMRAATLAHDQLGDATRKAMAIYDQIGPSWSDWTDKDVPRLYDELTGVIDELNVARGQKKVSDSQYNRFLKALPSPTGWKSKYQPEALHLALQQVAGDNDDMLSAAARANNYVPAKGGPITTPTIENARSGPHENAANMNTRDEEARGGKSAPATDDGTAPPMKVKGEVQEPTQPWQVKGDPKMAKGFLVVKATGQKVPATLGEALAQGVDKSTKYTWVPE